MHKKAFHYRGRGMASRDLSKARKAKNDEFYTQFVDIENELVHYRDFFRGKKVLCNCDDPYESNFFKYFALNFKFFGLKQLVATCYSGSPVSDTELQLFPNESPVSRTTRVAHKIIMKEPLKSNEDGSYNMNTVDHILKNSANVLTKLKGNGDFRSAEIVELLKDSDVVVTNPPFSLFREYVAQLVEYNKKFIIIGNKNSVTTKEIYSLFMQNKIWLGITIHSGGRWFRVPDSYTLSKNSVIRKDGHKYVNIPAPRWFTNVDNKNRHEYLKLFRKYDPSIYPKYDNYDAINVGMTQDIPEDYTGVMGVPITFLDKYNPEQFEILGIDKDFTTDKGRFKLTRNGLTKTLYARLVIRKIK